MASIAQQIMQNGDYSPNVLGPRILANLPTTSPTATGSSPSLNTGAPVSTAPLDPGGVVGPTPTSSTTPSTAPDPTTDLRGWINATLKSYGSTDDPNYWYNQITQGGGYSPYWANRIQYANGGPLAGQTPAGSTPGGTSTSTTGGATLPPGLQSSIMPPDASIWTQPFGQTFQAPAPVNNGGPAGTPYVPPVPQFQFNAPTEQQAQNTPGYQFAKNQALGVMQNSAAGQGLLNSSGTIFNLGNLANSLADQNYNNLWNQQYQVAQQQYQPLYNQWNQLANAGQQQTQSNFTNALDAYTQNYNQYRNLGNDTWNRAYQALTA